MHRTTVLITMWIWFCFACIYMYIYNVYIYMCVCVYTDISTINDNFLLTTSSKLHEIFDIVYIALVYGSLQSWTLKFHMDFKLYSSWTFLTAEQLFYLIHCVLCVFIYIMRNGFFTLFYLCLYFVRNDEIKLWYIVTWDLQRFSS